MVQPVSSVGSDVLPPVGSLDSSAVSSISIPPAVSGPGGSSFVLPCACPAVSLNLHSASGTYSFKSHPVVTWASSYFLNVELHSVRVSVNQSRGFSATTTSPAILPFYRYGLVPSGTVVKSNDRSICSIPRLVNYQLNMVGSSSTTQFGDGGLSFPPGLQLDFKPVQFRTNYVSFLIGRGTVLPTQTVTKEENGKKYKELEYDVDDISNVIEVVLDFTISCSAPGFGILP